MAARGHLTPLQQKARGPVPRPAAELYRHERLRGEGEGGWREKRGQGRGTLRGQLMRFSCGFTWRENECRSEDKDIEDHCQGFTLTVNAVHLFYLEEQDVCRNEN